MDGAAAGGVEGHCVGRGAVDAFDYVDFSHCGPVGADEPEGRPDATDAARHVCDVSQEQASIEGFGGGDADALPPSVGGGVVVDPHISSIAVVADGTYHFFFHSSRIVDVFHETSCGVCFCEWREGVEEIVALVIVREYIAGYAPAEEGR